MAVEVIKPSIQSTVYEDPPINKMSCGRKTTSQNPHPCDKPELSWGETETELGNQSLSMVCKH